MIVNPQALRGIYVGFNTLFNKVFAEQTTFYQRVATVVPSTTSEETYAWLGDIPGMREWIGDREIKSLTAHSYTIRNKDWEMTIGVPRNAVEDDGLGVYNPRVQMMGHSAATHPDELVFGLLLKGFTEPCYDGKPFFAEDHAVGFDSVSNVGTDPLSMKAYTKARAAIMSMKNDEGRSLNLIPDLLVVPPALEEVAREILIADTINGTKNTMRGTAEVLVVPQLAEKDTAWYLLCTSRPLKPLLYQLRKKPEFVSKTAVTDDNVFMKKEFLYGCDCRDNAGFGFWQMAYASSGAGDTSKGK